MHSTFFELNGEQHGKILRIEIFGKGQDKMDVPLQLGMGLILY